VGLGLTGRNSTVFRNFSGFIPNRLARCTHAEL
jgi:hypothetical protein